ncbi:uncharacterized protein RJT20DRAFT_125965 [Scheffersomyces xylosifermentans]|uniref:uncharacterized protein n=1 Tax=Scheffersomyces xylosifermentans TaxID=1304137 RepID=UPI00315CE759
MTQNFNLETELRNFRTQRYPTVEETVTNNASVLYKRKKFFLEDLRQSVKVLGFVLLGIVYLRDLSMLQLVLRAFSHYSISNPFPQPNPRVMLSDENKRAITVYLMMGLLTGNVFCILRHAIFGVYKKSPSADGYLHGGMFIQFIGERLPYSTLELLALDVLIFVVQLVFHSLMCVIDDSVVLESKRQELDFASGETIDKAHIEGDGYNGNVFLLNVDFIASARKVMKYRDRFKYGSNALGVAAATGPVTQPPGAYPV